MPFTPLQISDLRADRAIVDSEGRPTTELLRAINGNLLNIRNVLGELVDFASAIQAAQDAADLATEAALVAQDAADVASEAAGDAAGQTALQSSYPTGLTITATDVGASVTVTISAHTRVYPQAGGSNVSVSVNGGSLTGLAYSTDYWIYYDDPTHAGGAVTYVATTSDTTAAQIGDRHAVGGVSTPAAAAAPVIGKPTKAAGIVDLR